MRKRVQEIGDKNLIGKNITAIREKQGISQKELLKRLIINGGADSLGASALSKVEGQQRLVTDMELVAISKALDVKIEDLLNI